MFRRFHQLRDDEEGQSIVIACVALLILALGAFATVNLGRAVHQRIALQNTADSSAYSMAALEARAFNYYAFANRTQVVHYVSAMVLQSYLSFASFLQAVAGELVSMLHTLNQCNTGGRCVKLMCKVLQAIPVIGEVVTAIIEVVDALDKVATAALEVVNALFDGFDIFVGKVAIPALRFMNWLLWASTKIVAVDVATDLLGGYDPVITKNDDQVKASSIVGVLNELSYKNAHNAAAGGDPINPADKGSLPDNAYLTGDSDLARAKRGMGEVTNATRYNRFVVSRLATDFMPPFLANFVKLFQNVPLLKDVFKKFGQTKFTSKAIGANGRFNYIHSVGYGSSDIAQGNVLGADDLYRFAIGPDTIGFGPLSIDNPLVRGEKELKDGSWRAGGKQPSQSKLAAVTVSVWAQEKGGRHWRLVPNRNGADAAGIYSKKYGPFFCKVKIFYANVRLDTQDSNHDWEGLTPFEDFNASDTAKDQFHQPSTFSYINKSYTQTKHDNGDTTDRLKGSELKVQTGTAGVGGPSNIDTTNSVSMPKPLDDGSYNVISRGMVYYHRPHNWEEPPNFFNPYWRPKLDPVINGAGQMPFASQLMSLLPAALQKKALVH